MDINIAQMIIDSVLQGIAGFLHGFMVAMGQFMVEQPLQAAGVALLVVLGVVVSGAPRRRARRRY